MRKCLIVLAIIFFSSMVIAQDSSVAINQATQTFSTLGYKAEDINNKLKALDQRADLVPVDKERFTKLYSEALDRIREIESFRVQKEEYDAKIKSAPEEMVRFSDLLKDVMNVVDDYNPGMSLDQIEQKYAGLQVELSQVQREASALSNEPQRRATRRTEIPKEISEINERIISNSQKSVDVTTETSLDELKQAMAMVKDLTEASLKARLASLESELAMYNARGDLLTVRRDYYTKRQQVLAEQVKKWEERVTERRKIEAEVASQQAQVVASEVATSYPVLTDLSNTNLDIAQKQGDIVRKIENVGRELKTIEARAQSLKAEYEQIRKMVTEVGLTPAIGYQLHNKRVGLQDVKVNRNNLKKRLETMSQAMFELLDYDLQLSNLKNISASVEEEMNNLDMPDGKEKQDLAAKVEQLLTDRRGSLETLVGHYREYSNILTSIDVKERDYIAQFTAYENFINEHILWVKNTQPISISSFLKVGPEIKEMFSPSNVKAVFSAFISGFKDNLFRSVILFILLAGAFLLRYINRRKMGVIARQVSVLETDKYVLTLEVLLLTFFYSIPIPMISYVIGWTLQKGGTDNAYVVALSSAFMALATYNIVMFPLRNIFMNNGLAISHFGFSNSNARLIYVLSTWFVVLLQPLLLILYLQYNLEDADWKYQFSRLVFMVIMALFSVFLAIILLPGKGIIAKQSTETSSGKTLTFWNILYVFSVLTPLALAVFAWQGYFYAAWQLQVRVFLAFACVLVFMLIYGLIKRKIHLSQKRIIAWHLEQEKKQHPNETVENEEFSEEEVGDYCDQICRFVRIILSFGYLIAILIIFRDIFPALAVLDKVKLWQVLAEDQSSQWITLASVLRSLTIIIITIFLARNITGLINIALMKSISGKEGTRFAILALTRYMIVLVGVFWSFAEIGIGWGKVQWLAAAFTVGLGFGLQEIFANFISGLILLFEQPMRVGDVVTVGEVSGKVTHINTRSTTINCWDKKELIIPNKEFITGKLINWTLSDNLNRIVFKVGVAYGSDIEKVEKTLLRIARFRKGVVWKPKPTVVFTSFGDSCLDFQLRVYINDMDDYLDVWHGINCAIDTEFRKEKIEIAFPQRDLHIRTVNSEPFSIRMEQQVSRNQDIPPIIDIPDTAEDK